MWLASFTMPSSMPMRFREAPQTMLGHCRVHLVDILQARELKSVTDGYFDSSKLSLLCGLFLCVCPYLSLLPSMVSEFPYHLASIPFSPDSPTSFVTQVLVPVDRTVFPRHHDPHNSLHAPAREGNITNTKLVDSVPPIRQCPQANLS